MNRHFLWSIIAILTICFRPIECQDEEKEDRIEQNVEKLFQYFYEWKLGKKDYFKKSKMIVNGNTIKTIFRNSFETVKNPTKVKKILNYKE